MCRWVEARRVILGHAIHRKRKLEDDLGCHDDDNFEIHTIKSMRRINSLDQKGYGSRICFYASWRHERYWNELQATSFHLERANSHTFWPCADWVSSTSATATKRLYAWSSGGLLIGSGACPTATNRNSGACPKLLPQWGMPHLKKFYNYLLVVGHAPPPQIAAQVE